MGSFSAVRKLQCQNRLRLHTVVNAFASAHTYAGISLACKQHCIIYEANTANGALRRRQHFASCERACLVHVYKYTVMDRLSNGNETCLQQCCSHFHTFCHTAIRKKVVKELILMSTFALTAATQVTVTTSLRTRHSAKTLGNSLRLPFFGAFSLHVCQHCSSFRSVRNIVKRVVGPIVAAVTQPFLLSFFFGGARVSPPTFAR